MSKRMLVLMCSIFLIVPLLFMGCGSDGSDGKNGINGTNGTNGTSGRDLTATPQPESCAICHEATTTGSILSGADHQAFYDSLFQDNVLRVTGLTYALNGSNQDNVTFTMSLAGAPFDCRDADALNVYWVPTTDNDTFTASRTLKTTVTYLGAGVCSVTKASLDNVSLSTKNGFIVVYGYDHFVSNLLPSRVKQESYPFAALLTEGTASYASAANVSGCEKCHTIPYLKHGQIYGEVNHVAATDFITCKACHMDLDGGGHQFWQELVDNPVIATHDFNGTLTSADNAYVAAHYAYKTRLMNDVHMSHAMEFGYPQSMANCATCHAGKLNQIFTDNNFTLETCRSCHPVTGSAQAEKTQPALKDILPAAIHGTYDLYNNATNCNGCHKAGGIAPVFSAIHTGYDKKIYTDNGIKYSSIFNVTIDNASFDNTNKLTIGFSATGSQSGLVPTNIVPTVLVGLYGWDTKDFLFGPHETNADGKRNLEFVVTDNTHPRMKLVSAGGGHWTVTANLSQWADNIVAGNVKRVEIAVLPTLAYSALPAGDNVLALNAPSRTYNLGAKAFVNNYYAGTNAIVNVAAGCNTCHDALATTFHTADRGGNIVVCRLCHITKAGASHLEMESRSIDSYAHAIHTFQAFDIGSVHFDNAVQSMYYDLKIESHFPTFDSRDCVACHYAGKFEVPDQSKSLPGVFSASAYPLIGKTRAIGTVPAYISGPASRACGGCHRAELIKEDDIATLTAFNSHVRTNGYLLETTSATATADVTKVIFQVMSNYSETIVLPAP